MSEERRVAAELERIEEQLRRSFEGEAWHGPAVLETLAGVSHADAAAHPIEGAHSIWELALHLSSDYRLVLRRLSGDGRQLTKEEGWPPPPEATQEAGGADCSGRPPRTKMGLRSGAIDRLHLLKRYF